MKNFKEAYFKKLIGFVSAGAMSFSKMCEIINKDIEAEKIKAYNQAIDDVDNLIEEHEEEVYIGVVDDILKLKKAI